MSSSFELYIIPACTEAIVRYALLSLLLSATTLAIFVRATFVHKSASTSVLRVWVLTTAAGIAGVGVFCFGVCDICS